MVSILLQRRLKYVNYLWKHVTSILTIPSNQEVQKSAFSKIGARPWNTEIPRSLTELTKMSFKSRRPSPNVPGYFWIRNFFFPDSKIYPSKHPMVSRFTDLEKLRRPEVRRPHVFRFVADLFFSLSLSGEWFKRISGFAVECRMRGRKPYPESNSCWFKNMRICAERALNYKVCWTLKKMDFFRYTR